MQFCYGCRNLLGMGTRTRALGVESCNRGGVGSGQSPVRCSRMLLSRGAFRYTFILWLVAYPIHSTIIVINTTKHTLPFTPLLSRCHSQQRGGEQGDGALVLITQGAEGPGHFQRNGLDRDYYPAPFGPAWPATGHWLPVHFARHCAMSAALSTTTGNCPRWLPSRVSGRWSTDSR